MIEVGQIYKWYPYRAKALGPELENESFEFEIIVRLKDRAGWTIKYTSNNMPSWANTNHTWLRDEDMANDINIFLVPEEEPKTRLQLILDEWIP